MTYSTIYDLEGYVITDGVQSQRVCDATINTARQIARDKGRSVVVEDRGTREVYRITPTGRRWRAPTSWPAPTWDTGDCAHIWREDEYGIYVCTKCDEEKGER